MSDQFPSIDFSRETYISTKPGALSTKSLVSFKLNSDSTNGLNALKSIISVSGFQACAVRAFVLCVCFYEEAEHGDEHECCPRHQMCKARFLHSVIVLVTIKNNLVHLDRFILTSCCAHLLGCFRPFSQSWCPHHSFKNEQKHLQNMSKSYQLIFLSLLSLLVNSLLYKELFLSTPQSHVIFIYLCQKTKNINEQNFTTDCTD